MSASKNYIDVRTLGEDETVVAVALNLAVPGLLPAVAVVEQVDPIAPREEVHSEVRAVNAGAATSAPQSADRHCPQAVAQRQRLRTGVDHDLSLIHI